MAVAPPAGSTRNWNPNVLKVVQELERVFDVKCSTYPGHGRTGEAWGIDVWVEKFRNKADASSVRLGDRIQKYCELHHERLGIGYMIWWNWMIEYPGAFLISNRSEWFSYEPHAREWNRTHPNADDEPDTVRHFDHDHLQILVGHVYRAPDGGNGEKTDYEKAQIIDRYFSSLQVFDHVPYEPIGKTLIEECRRQGEKGLWVSTAAALVEQESAGRNLFGCDHGATGDKPPFCHHRVTQRRVERLVGGGKFPKGMNGIGLTQLTWWTYVMDAEKMGGAHVPRYQMRVGFKFLNDLLNTYGYLDALEAYNDGKPGNNDPSNHYDLQFAEKHRALKDRLN